MLPHRHFRTPEVLNCPSSGEYLLTIIWEKVYVFLFCCCTFRCLTFKIISFSLLEARIKKNHKNSLQCFVESYYSNKTRCLLKLGFFSDVISSGTSISLTTEMLVIFYEIINCIAEFNQRWSHCFRATLRIPRVYHFHYDVTI